MRVAFVLPRDFGFPIGGYKVVYEYANRLVRRGWRVDVVHVESLDRGVSLRDLLCVRPLLRRRPPTWFALDRRVRLRHRPAWSRWWARRADRVVATAWQTAEAIGRDRRGLYLIQHYEVWAGPTDRVDATWRLPMPKVVIAEWLAERAAELGGGHVTVVHNGLDLRALGVDVDPEDRTPTEVAMLWHSEEWKGTADGLEALGRVREDWPDLHLTVFSTSGPPPDLPPWVSFVRDAGPQQLREIYNRCAVFLSPSHREGWGLTVAEAMACGAAVVSTRNGGIDDFGIDGVNALLVAPGDIRAMARAVTSLLADERRRFGLARQGRARAEEMDWDRSVDRFEAVLRAGRGAIDGSGDGSGTSRDS